MKPSMLTTVAMAVVTCLRSNGMTMLAWRKALRCDRERWCLIAGHPWAAQCWVRGSMSGRRT